MGNLIKKENKVLVGTVYINFGLWMFQFLVYDLLGGMVTPIHFCINVIRAYLIIYSAYIWFKYSFANIFIAYGVAFAILIVQFIVFSENVNYISGYILDFFLLCLPCYINMTMIGDNQSHINIMCCVAWLVFIFGEIYFFLYANKISENEEYSMSYSYYMLFGVLVFIYLFFYEGKKLYILPIILSILSMLLIGSRGAVLASVCYFLILVFIVKKNKIIRVAIIGAIISGIINIERIKVLLLRMLIKMDINSRSMKLLLDGEFVSHDSGRSKIYSQAIDLIKKHPFVGNGMGADSRILKTYTHNLFLDFFVHFGVIIGIFIIVIMITVMIIGFIKSENKPLYFLLFFIGFFPLMVSGTYLSYFSFWIYMGYCIGKLKIVFCWGMPKGKSEEKIQC